MFIKEIHSPNITEGINDPNIFKAIFVAGPPGAGKNFVIQKLGLMASGLKLQDIDQIGGMLKRIGTPGSDVHSKSIDFIKRRQQLFQSQMLGLIINTTGRDFNTLIRLNDSLKEIGYDTFMLYVTVEKDIALKRIQRRPRVSTNIGDVGREVDIDYFEQAYTAVANNAELYALIFDNQFAMVTNNDELAESAPPTQTFKDTLIAAMKKVHAFLRKPLTPKAQQTINSMRRS